MPVPDGDEAILQRIKVHLLAFHFLYALRCESNGNLMGFVINNQQPQLRKNLDHLCYLVFVFLGFPLLTQIVDMIQAFYDALLNPGFRHVHCHDKYLRSTPHL